MRIECTGASIEQVAEGLQVQVPGEDATVVPLEATDPEIELLNRFRQFVEEGVEPTFSGRNNLVIVGLIEALGVASDRGAVLDFSEFMASESAPE